MFLVILSGPGGKLVIFETSKAGRLTDGVYPSFINGVIVFVLILHLHEILLLRETFSTLTLTLSTRTVWSVPTRMAQ